MRPPKIDFRFLFYTSKITYFKKTIATTFFNANLLEKYLILGDGFMTIYY